MRVAIAGATGLLGTALVARLRADGCTITTIGRGSNSDIKWDPSAGALDARALRGCDALVNLAGATISRRWTARRRAEIVASRVQGATLLCRAIAQLDDRPRTFISGSAVGFYGDRGDEILSEESGGGRGFLAELVQVWETAASEASKFGTRVVLLRSGVALSPRGGMLAELLLPFRLGLGGPIGDATQWLSWISLHDHARALAFVLRRDDLAGALNIVAPNAVTNAEFAKTLAAVLRRPAMVRVPAVALRLAYGQMADETILASQRAVPKRLRDAGFVFDDPELEGALRRELGRPMR
jgi:uncharacterized protein (TIGR01777 family)